MNPLIPETFEDLHLHHFCGVHIQMIYYVHSMIAVFMDLLPILLGLLLFMYQDIHRSLAIYPQFFQYYDRIYTQYYYIVYNSIIFFWILFYFLHILSIGFSIIFGIRLKKPYLMIPQMIFLSIRLLILTVLFAALLTFIFVGSEFPIYSTLIIFVLLVFSGTYLVSTAFCFRFVYERYSIIQIILANSKTVHFKDKKRRK